MVDIVRFQTGVESFLPDYDRVFHGVFPKETSFQTQGEAIERHMTNIFSQYETVQEQLFKSIKPYTFSAAITTPNKYQTYLDSTRHVLRAHTNRFAKQKNRKTSSLMKNAAALLKNLQSDTHLLNLYKAATVKG